MRSSFENSVNSVTYNGNNMTSVVTSGNNGVSSSGGWQVYCSMWYLLDDGRIPADTSPHDVGVTASGSPRRDMMITATGYSGVEQRPPATVETAVGNTVTTISVSGTTAESCVDDAWIISTVGQRETNRGDNYTYNLVVPRDFINGDSSSSAFGDRTLTPGPFTDSWTDSTNVEQCMISASWAPAGVVP